jgi:hypothetical protein
MRNVVHGVDKTGVVYKAFCSCAWIKSGIRRVSVSR